MLFKDSQRKKINHNVWKQAIPTLWSKTEGSDPLQLSRNLQNIEEIFLAFPASILKRTLNFQHSRIFHKLETGFLKTHYKFPKSSNYRRFPNNMKYNKTHTHKKNPQNNQQTNNTNAFNEGLHCSGICETFKQFSFLWYVSWRKYWLFLVIRPSEVHSGVDYIK